MRRRQFMAGLAGAVMGLAFDPERALWVPGQKLISIPTPKVWKPVVELQMWNNGWMSLGLAEEVAPGRYAVDLSPDMLYAKGLMVRSMIRGVSEQSVIETAQWAEWES